MEDIEPTPPQSTIDLALVNTAAVKNDTVAVSRTGTVFGDIRQDCNMLFHAGSEAEKLDIAGRLKANIEAAERRIDEVSAKSNLNRKGKRQALQSLEREKKKIEALKYVHATNGLLTESLTESDTQIEELEDAVTSLVSLIEAVGIRVPGSANRNSSAARMIREAGLTRS